jgi:glucuronate isomerase
MKPFLSHDFLLQTATAQRLYDECAALMPIIDYHNHLPPEQIAEDRQFANITQAWLYGDHYKWRAMRANGVSEHFITGPASDWEKFEKWAETVPATLRNPLYHWTHLELQRYFGISELLGPASARRIYDACNALLQTPEYSVRGLLRKMNVHTLCTTDDPADSLEHHQAIARSGFEVQVLPTFRPDKAMAVDEAATYNAYLDRLGAAAGRPIHTFDDLQAALRQRHDFFATQGCRLADHGLEHLYASPCPAAETARLFAKIRSGKELTLNETHQLKSEIIVFLAHLNWEKGWAQQVHVGALRNNNSRALRELGPDTGWDSIGDFAQGRALSSFLNRLDTDNQLAKTILYNLNPADNELFATMIGNFNDGSVAGKMQWGSGWWFLDQKDGMEKQLNTLSNMGLLSRFVGMLTDSRSFLSFPRHEYFRRVLCNLLGRDVENGELPNEMELLGPLVRNICHHNAEQYFSFTKAHQSALAEAAATA